MIDEVLEVPDHLSVARADFSRSLAWIDGAFVPLAEARVPVRDFGLMYADMTYDVVHAWRGGFFRLDDHLDRFETSCAGLRLDPGLSRAELATLLATLVERSGLADALVYFACTRGTAPPGSRDPRMATNRFFAYAQPLVLRGQPDEMRRGLHATISTAIRRIPETSVNPVWKNTHWGDFTRALFLAKDDGFDTVILLDHDGGVAEGPGFNVVAVTSAGLLAADSGVLEGISCRTMMEIAGELGIPGRYGRLSPEVLRGADEAFITSTSCGLFPVTRIDAAPIGTGRPGPVATRLLNTYYRRKNAGWNITPVATILAAAAGRGT